MDPSFDDGKLWGFDTFVLAVGTLFATFFVGIVVLAIVSARRRNRALREAGLDPRLTGQEQLAAIRARDADGRGPRRSVEERLGELDELLRREVVTPEEHRAARSRILGEI